jgi:hypothetical protein
LLLKNNVFNVFNRLGKSNDEAMLMCEWLKSGIVEDGVLLASYDVLSPSSKTHSSTIITPSLA